MIEFLAALFSSIGHPDLIVSNFSIAVIMLLAFIQIVFAAFLCLAFDKFCEAMLYTIQFIRRILP